MKKLLLCVLLGATACRDKPSVQQPAQQTAATPAATASAAATTPVDAAPPTAKPSPPRLPRPLDPVRQKAADANREALARMARAIRCPQKSPSAFVPYCNVAARFASGTAAPIPEGKTLLLAGVAAFIAPSVAKGGAAGAVVGTLGTSIPVVFALRNDDGGIRGKQTVLQPAVPEDQTDVATAVGRIAGALDGKWDHVDMPAAFAPQIAALGEMTFDALEVSGGSYWPLDRDGMELRRAGDQWMLVAGIPDGRRLVAVFTERMKILAADEKSPQTINVLRLK